MKQNKHMTSFFYGILYLCILIGAVLHVAVYCYNRSLWNDEVLLARSIFTRDFSSLVASPLDFGQSAPIGYLYIVKTLTVFFGGSETVLRIWSLITGLGSIALLFAILKYGLQLKKSMVLFTTAVFSLLPYFIRYSNEFKPYMSDNFFVLLSILLFLLYLREHIALRQVIVAYTGIIWFSFSAVFVIAGCMILIVIRLLLQWKMYRIDQHKDLQHKIIYRFAGCFVVLLSFCVYYFVWLQNTSANAGDPTYWNLLRFPLIPRSVDDLRLIYQMILQIVSPINVRSYFIYMYMMLSVCAILFSFKKKEPYFALLVAIVFILTLIASFLGFFPIQDRLCQFLSILLLLLASVGLDNLSDWIWQKRREKKAVIILWNTVALIGMFVMLTFVGYFGTLSVRPSKVYRSNSEIRENVNYIKEHLTENDFVYLSVYAFKAFEYYMDYDISVLHPSDKYDVDADFYRNEIYGHTYAPYIFGRALLNHLYDEPYSYNSTIDNEAVKADVTEISRHDSVYILTYLSMKDVESLLDELRKTGTVTIVKENQKTHVYHYVPYKSK